MNWDTIWKTSWAIAGGPMGFSTVIFLTIFGDAMAKGAYIAVSAVICFVLYFASEVFLGMLDLALTAVPADSIDLEWLRPWYTSVAAWCPLLTYLALFTLWTTYKVLVFSVRTVLRLVPGISVGT